MIKILRNSLILLCIMAITTLPVLSKGNPKSMLANIEQEFNMNNIPSEVYFKTSKKTKILDEITIPQRSIVRAEVLQAQKERRWHKSGFIVCKLKSYLVEMTEEPVDISDKDIYIVVKKYEPVNKKDAAILGTEILLTQSAAFFAPGVDILYFFTKGAILREKDPNWFKAGVHNAYDNSICWFWLKGKTIDVKANERMNLKTVDESKALKLTKQIQARNVKYEQKLIKKQAKAEIKNQKKLAKQEKKKNKKNQKNKKYKNRG